MITLKHMHLIRKLQGIHDDFEVIDWKSKLIQLAKEYELE